MSNPVKLVRSDESNSNTFSLSLWDQRKQLQVVLNMFFSILPAQICIKTGVIMQAVMAPPTHDFCPYTMYILKMGPSHSAVERMRDRRLLNIKFIFMLIKMFLRLLLLLGTRSVFFPLFARSPALIMTSFFFLHQL